MIARPDNFAEAMAMLHLKESEFEQAVKAVENALAHGKTGEQELSTMNEIASDLAELAEQISDQIQKKLGSL
ncbi:hypothetical protein A3736_09455 [Erythrobacter sp. HI0063]|jgi:hypothetical protein|uniref:hypothetical protein n=1 Tax=Erythrobacter sp. HI0063 TaxID=1822240 RepID=UPI0007C2F97E|nr:hypothetical protein [Erythrobacter sp. HI0063]KZY55821.1 hypothetical protein A3736_09455 [Erythrobacter sp. HI0063]|tara:strand:+ start:1097 stop:1312 length:216 start_codon:yes stop_codon:yes gene_type:complete